MTRQCPSCGGFCKKSGCERENVKPKEWVGLSVNEARDFYEKYTDWEELIYAIDKFLEEKNT